jgi:hypothetical protein
LTNIQPVLPFTLNDDWNLISRTILPVIDQHGLAPNRITQANRGGLISPKRCHVVRYPRLQ